MRQPDYIDAGGKKIWVFVGLNTATSAFVEGENEGNLSPYKIRIRPCPPTKGEIDYDDIQEEGQAEFVDRIDFGDSNYNPSIPFPIYESLTIQIYDKDKNVIAEGNFDWRGEFYFSISAIPEDPLYFGITTKVIGWEMPTFKELPLDKKNIFLLFHYSDISSDNSGEIDNDD